MINNEAIQSYLVCPYKSFLKFQGIEGVNNRYTDYYNKTLLILKNNVLSHKFKNANIITVNEEIDRNILNANNIIIDGVIKKATEFELTIDFIESSKKDNTIFIVPILIYEKEYISKLQKLYITM